METNCISMILITFLFKSTLCNTNKTILENASLNGPVVKVYVPVRSPVSGKDQKEVIQKEDSSEVEEFLIDEDPFIYENRGVYPPNQYPGRYYPEYPRNNFFPSGAGGDVDAFTARRAADIELLPGRKVRFLDTVAEVGRGWKRLISEFVCELPGVFFFTFSACGERYRHFRITLMHNEIGVVSAYGDVNGYQMASNSAVLRLLPGDRVYLQLDEGGIYEVTTISGRAYNTFSGFRIL
ncbi:UNVERIFIED_CONTAM: hypothetical protein RMT77_013244 [Armadillidium vulgare]